VSHAEDNRIMLGVVTSHVGFQLGLEAVNFCCGACPRKRRKERPKNYCQKLLPDRLPHCTSTGRRYTAKCRKRQLQASFRKALVVCPPAQQALARNAT
jgi:hypothetical protein